MTSSGTAQERFTKAFGPKPILAMLHLKGDTRSDTLDRAIAEVNALQEAGVDAVVVENYFGDITDMEAVLEYLASAPNAVTYGLNALDDDGRGFDLARTYGASFLQLDSVAGHLPRDQDCDFAAWLADQRRRTDALVLGGVRFKYQPYRSGNSLDTDLAPDVLT